MKITRKETDLLWALVRSGVWHADATTQGDALHVEKMPKAEVDMKKVFSKAVQTGLNGYVMEALGMECLPAYQELKVRYAAENKVIRELFAMFHERGLHPVLLKGQAYARHYPNPTARVIGDIDIYIPQQEWEQALAFVQSLPNVEIEWSTNEKHIEFRFRNHSVEMHYKCAVMRHDMRVDTAFQLWSDKVLSETTAGFFIDENGQCGDVGEWISTPPLLFEVFFCFLHLWLHIVPSTTFRPRSFVDLAVMLRRYGAELDTVELGNWLNTYHFTNAWQQVGCFLSRNLGLQPTEIPFYSDKYEKDRRLEDVMRYSLDFEESRAIELKSGFVKRHAMAMRRRLCNLWYSLKIAPIRLVGLYVLSFFNVRWQRLLRWIKAKL